MSNEEELELSSDDNGGGGSGDDASGGGGKNGIGIVKDTILSLILVLTLVAVYRDWNAMDRKDKGVLREACVTGIDEVAYNGPDEAMKNVRYRVELTYVSNLIECTEYVYYRNVPDLEVGENVRIKVNVFDASDIISIVGD